MSAQAEPAPADLPLPKRALELPRLHKVMNLVLVIGPFVGVVAAIALFWGQGVSGVDLAIMGALYVPTALGITIGYHRLLTHRSFETYGWVKATFAVLGSLAVEGAVITWVADHRKHHAFSDEEGDPHSPHAGRAPGFLGALGGLFHAHMGWLFSAEGRAAHQRFARDLLEDRSLRAVNLAFFPLVLTSLALPFGLGWAITGTVAGGVTAFVWGGLVRIFLLHHVTFSINSVCHFFGRRRFPSDDESRNVFWLALPSLGEAWHNNHHAFPTSASHGLRRWEVDPSALVIRGLERAGLAWNVVRVSPERQECALGSAGG